MTTRRLSTYDIAKLGEVEAEILGRGKTHEAVPTGVVRASYNNNRLPCAVIFSEAPGRDPVSYTHLTLPTKA